LLFIIVGNEGDLQELNDEYTDFLTKNGAEHATWIKKRCHQKPTFVGPPFDQGPGDIGKFYDMLELVHKLVESIKHCRCFYTNEDVGKGMAIGATAVAAVGFMRTVFEDDASSDEGGFHIHRPFLAFLKAYLLPRVNVHRWKGAGCVMHLCGMTILREPGQRWGISATLAM